MNQQNQNNAENMTQKLSHMADQAADQARESVSKMTNSIGDNPMTSVLLAGVIGFMLGVLTKK